MPQAQQLGRYHLLDRIAYGGMAEIFRAKTFDANGNIHLVAIKRLLGHLITDEEFLDMLVDEAKVSATLQHQNIARVYEFGHAADEYFLAMEYIDGKDVRGLLEKSRQTGRPIPPEHAAWIAMEVAMALHAAHTTRDPSGAALRIVHRDVSPSNVLCSYRGDVKLCDFGIAKATLTRVQTKTGVIKGKVKYMSPEQAMGRKLDHRSDVFSLGTVLYEMLTLQAPFQAPTEVELIFAVRDARKKPLRDLAPECPPELATIVDRAMTRSRAARYQSGEQLALELRNFLDAYKPGYRRSHFSRYMRKQFAAEIERELRVLEGYTIEHADSTLVGDNLIADALGPDAPWNRFTPVYSPHFPLDRRPLNQEGPPSQRPTRPPPAAAPRLQTIGDLARERGAAATATPARSDFHEQETRLISRESLHDQSTRLFSAPDFGGLLAPGGPGARKRAAPPVEDPTEQRSTAAARGETGEVLDPDDLVEVDPDLHEQSTRILDLPALPTQAALGRDRKLRVNPSAPEPQPLAPLHREETAIVRVRGKKRDSEGSDESSLPLSDEDLEPL